MFGAETDNERKTARSEPSLPDLGTRIRSHALQKHLDKIERDGTLTQQLLEINWASYAWVRCARLIIDCALFALVKVDVDVEYEALDN